MYIHRHSTSDKRKQVGKKFVKLLDVNVTDVCYRVLMAHAEELSDQVKQLSSRVQELEEMLQMQARLSNAAKSEQMEPQSCPPKPGSPAKLDNYHEAIRNSSPETIEENLRYGAEVKRVTDRIGSLAIGQEGQMRYRGETAGAEVCEQ